MWYIKVKVHQYQYQYQYQYQDLESVHTRPVPASTWAKYHFKLTLLLLLWLCIYIRRWIEIMARLRPPATRANIKRPMIQQCNWFTSKRNFLNVTRLKLTPFWSGIQWSTNWATHPIISGDEQIILFRLLYCMYTIQHKHIKTNKHKMMNTNATPYVTWTNHV